MVMTVLEARVTQENWPALEQAYQQAAQQPRDPGLVQSFLLHDTRDPERWRIGTVWSSMEALSAMRASGATPTGVLIFRAAQAEPGLSIFDIAHAIPIA